MKERKNKKSWSKWSSAEDRSHFLLIFSLSLKKRLTASRQSSSSIQGGTDFLSLSNGATLMNARKGRLMAVNRLAVRLSEQKRFHLDDDSLQAEALLPANLLFLWRHKKRENAETKIRVIGLEAHMINESCLLAFSTNRSIIFSLFI